MSKKMIMLALIATMTVALGATASAQDADQSVDSNEQPPAAQPAPEKRKSGSSSLPDDVPGLQKAAVEAYQEERYLRFVQATMLLRKLRPYEPQYLIGMVIGAARIDRPNTAYNYMHIMQQQGLAYDFNTVEDTESIRNTEVYGYINDLLARADAPAGEGEVAFQLAEAGSYPESMAWDESRGKFLVGTLETGSVLAVSPTGETETLLEANEENGLLAIQGLAVDAANQRLWIASTGVPGFKNLKPEQLGQGALYEFNLETLERLNRFAVPSDGLPHLLASLAVTPAGDVYVVDRAVPMIFRKGADADVLEAYIGNPKMAGFRDLALNGKGDILYVADVGLGILRIELETATAGMLAVPETLNVGGISGLFHSGNSLFIIQNGINPQRLMRLDLDASGMSVADSSPIAVALDPFNYPAFGAVMDDNIYYFASSNTPGANDGPVRPTIMKSPLELKEEIVPVESIKFNEEVKDKGEDRGGE